MDGALVRDVGSTRVAEGLEKAGNGAAQPQKKYFRQRAHCNPLSFNDSFDYPATVGEVDWTVHYPAYAAKDGETARNGGTTQPVEFLDIGCGFGGLTVELARLFPDNLVMGMEIRAKVKEYVRLRIRALRSETEQRQYNNASVMRTNCMKYLPNYFEKGQLQKVFICFPDPHFKAKNHRRRIVTQQLLNEYAYFLAPGGILYTITDVKELHEWMARHGEEHACFQRIPDADLVGDAVCKAVTESTEEGKKVARNKGSKYLAVFRRSTTAEANAKAASAPFFNLPACKDPAVVAAAARAANSTKKSKKAKKKTPPTTDSEAVTVGTKKPRIE